MLRRKGIVSDYTYDNYGLNEAIKRARTAEMIAGTLGIRTELPNGSAPDPNGAVSSGLAFYT